MGKCPKASDPCRLCGLSVYDTWEAADVVRALYPAHGHLIARGALSAAHGTIKRTGKRNPHHYTWWPYEGVDRIAPFQIQLVAEQ
jgi:hypothetical protein